MKRKFLWQDVVMMIAGFSFTPSLIFSIIGHAEIPLATSIPTATALLVLMICTLSLRLYLTAIANLLSAICWTIIIFV